MAGYTDDEKTIQKGKSRKKKASRMARRDDIELEHCGSVGHSQLELDFVSSVPGFHAADDSAHSRTADGRELSSNLGAKRPVDLGVGNHQDARRNTDTVGLESTNERSEIMDELDARSHVRVESDERLLHQRPRLNSEATSSGGRGAELLPKQQRTVDTGFEVSDISESVDCGVGGEMEFATLCMDAMKLISCIDALIEMCMDANCTQDELDDLVGNFDDRTDAFINNCYKQVDNPLDKREP